jgi:hypothetical protein
MTPCLNAAALAPKRNRKRKRPDVESESGVALRTSKMPGTCDHVRGPLAENEMSPQFCFACAERLFTMRGMISASLKRIVLLMAAIIGSCATHAQQLKTRNVFLIISDGYRWQEVFTGAEEQLVSEANGGVKDTNALRAKFWRPTPEARRAALMPFLWNEIARHGQLFGNQNKGSVVKVTNGKNFSYPGYSEILTGYGDPRIDSNEKRPNPNTNVFEWINRQKGFSGRVAVLGTWDVFPFIFNCGRSGLPIWPAWGNSFAKEIQVPELLRRLTWDTPKLGSDIIFDSFVMQASFDYVKRAKPHLGFIGFGETDEWAHHKRYDEYLLAAQRVDSFVREFWTLLQSMPEYHDKTTLIITADHGRGTGPADWKSHGEKTADSAGDWIAVLGPDTPALGERANTSARAQNQIASTIAALLGLDYRAFFKQAGEPLQDVIKGR